MTSRRRRAGVRRARQRGTNVGAAPAAPPRGRREQPGRPRRGAAARTGTVSAAKRDARFGPLPRPGALDLTFPRHRRGRVTGKMANDVAGGSPVDGLEEALGKIAVVIRVNPSSRRPRGPRRLRLRLRRGDKRRRATSWRRRGGAQALRRIDEHTYVEVTDAASPKSVITQSRAVSAFSGPFACAGRAALALSKPLSFLTVGRLVHPDSSCASARRTPSRGGTARRRSAPGSRRRPSRPRRSRRSRRGPRNALRHMLSPWDLWYRVSSCFDSAISARTGTFTSARPRRSSNTCHASSSRDSRGACTGRGTRSRGRQ